MSYKLDVVSDKAGSLPHLLPKQLSVPHITANSSPKAGAPLRPLNWTWGTCRSGGGRRLPWSASGSEPLLEESLVCLEHHSRHCDCFYLLAAPMALPRLSCMFIHFMNILPVCVGQTDELSQDL